MLGGSHPHAIQAKPRRRARATWPCSSSSDQGSKCAFLARIQLLKPRNGCVFTVMTAICAAKSTVSEPRCTQIGCAGGEVTGGLAGQPDDAYEHAKGSARAGPCVAPLLRLQARNHGRRAGGIAAAHNAGAFGSKPFSSHLHKSVTSKSHGKLLVLQGPSRKAPKKVALTWK